MALESNIIFRIGTKFGPGGFASLKSAGQTIAWVADQLIGFGKAAIESYNEMQRFGQVYRALQIDITAADKASKSLIDTMTLMTQTNKMTATQMGLTSEMLKDITVMTTKFAQTTGQDATEVFKNFTQALLSGSTEVFRPYGIVVEGVTGILNVQKEVMKQVTERARDLNVQIETGREYFFKLGNTIDSLSKRYGNITQRMVDLSPIGRGFSHVTDVLNTALEKQLDIVDKSISKWEELVKKYQDAKKKSEELKKESEELNMRYLVQQAILAGQVKSPDLIRTLMSQYGLGGMPLSGKKEETAPLLGEQPYQQLQAEQMAALGLGTVEGYTAPAAGAPKGGGKGAEMMQFTAEEVDKSYQEYLADITGGMGAMEARAAAEEAAMNQMMGWTTDEEQQKIDERRQASQEWWDMIMIQHDWEMEQRENDLRYAEEFGDAWERAYGNMSSAALVAKGAQDLLHASITNSMAAAIFGAKGFKEAMMSAVRDVAFAIGVESTIRALYHAAMAIGAAATYRYDQAAIHGTAAATHGITAAAAFAIAGGANALMGHSAPAPSTGAGPGTGYTGGGPSYGNAPGYQEPQEVHVTITVVDDNKLFEIMTDANDRSSQAGGRSFARR